ncbi:hypothetical protein [Paludisphaera borealis]|uniref:Uncharacterized protein n=1 Tax=Paludisphaera borealis TaxID=1387353 RepID=A0A1U7CLL2_9BACT|nr:hypothetical protein [Paludisphaera borealis]APW59825.1 hypothetical protein BSF38_01283 [Paludisphaera borealis]
MRRGLFFAKAVRVFGLGLSLILAVFSGRSDGGDWSLPDGRMGIRTAPLLLLTRPDVQSDVKLEAAQIASLHKTIDDLSQRAQALRGKTGGTVIAERQAIDDAQSQWLTANLSEQQFSRLSQIDLQWEGSSALVSRPAVAEILKLSTSQVRELTHLIADRNARFIKNGFNPAEETAIRRKSLAILSNPQLQAWNGVLGDRCQFVTSPPPEPVVDPAAKQASHDAPR